MWGYYFSLGLRSSARSKALTALVIVLLAFGVSACMVSYAIFRATTGDPLSAKSSRLYVPQVDNFGPSLTWQGEPPDMLSYIDAVAIWQAQKASRQTILFPTTWQVESSNGLASATSKSGDAVTADFFTMFDLPFLFGTGWNAQGDAQHATVAVISKRLNEKMFAGQNSVGREIRLDGHIYRIGGVLDEWSPKPRFFDIGTLGPDQAFDDVGDIYIPFSAATDMKKDSRYASCPTELGTWDTSHWDSYLQSECGRIGAWVELTTPEAVNQYREFLRSYAEQQQRLGRFGWAPNVRLRNLMDWMAYRRVSPKVSSLSMLVSASFLLIILVNVVGLMLARFMQRAPEIGIRRALGASRADIYRQFLIEGAAVGFVGGLLGVVLTWFGLKGAADLFEPNIARLVNADSSVIAMTLLVAVLATVIATLYPTWRAAQTLPAWQIKINH